MKKVTADIFVFILLVFSLVVQPVLTDGEASAAPGCERMYAESSQDAPENLLGICERPETMTQNVDPGATPDLVADLSGALGADSFRIWMHYTNIVTVGANGALFVNASKDIYQSFIDKLKANGVGSIMAMSHYYLLPADLNAKRKPANGGKEIPLPGTSGYVRFLEMLEDTLYLLAVNFPDIKYWEPGNEPDMENAFVVKFDSDSVDAGAANNLFSADELAEITADICYYANRGIKRADPSNKLVMPGLIFMYETASPEAFITKLYTAIKSGELPAGGGYQKNTDADDYFDIACWHPYLSASRNIYETWLKTNLKFYEVMCANGDADKDVFFSEFGYSDFDQQAGAESAALIYDTQYFIARFFDTVKERMPFVKTVFMFRLLNWEYRNTAPKPREKYFGLFFSPAEPDGCLPKPVALQIFYYFNGLDADMEPLFKYVK